ncbi:MAG: TatD family deoxyribonuclease, partial [Ruminococcaceae bacterium]|nr:TatD family deoxyribonuclease [Oscillospiraceae bacterium]
ALRYVYSQGVRRICDVGASLRSSTEALAMADFYAGQEGYPLLCASVGLHPCDTLEVPDIMVQDVLDEIRQMAAHPKAVAVGEIGLDYYWDADHHDRQKRMFDLQLSLAEEVKKPVIIHDRDAHGDVFDILAAHPHVRGILHSYSGSPEMARQLADKGWYISFSGPVTYKNAVKVKESCAIVPDDLLLLETDAPYLPPVPHRGKMNHSGYLVHTAAVMAELRGTTAEAIAELTWRNACRIFDLPED